MADEILSDCPFSVGDNFKRVMPVLIQNVLETMAFIEAPISDQIPMASETLIDVAREWSMRATNLGQEDPSYAVVWELSRHVERLIGAGIPMPPYDIASRCADPVCLVDHAVQARFVNDVLESGRTRQPQDAVKAYARHVSREPEDEWRESRVEFVALLVSYIANRVSEYRSNATDEMPEIDQPPASLPN